MSIPTPHNSAKKGDIAKKVLMPGDPLRAKYIAETYLENPVCFNTVRNMFGYTGTYKGEQISVMGSGMGMPSMGIYSYELYNFYDVEKIIRIGSAGANGAIVITTKKGQTGKARHECMYGFKLCKPVSAAGDFCSYSKL